MSIPGSASSLFFQTAAGAGGYEIERSVRFNSEDSAYISRQNSSAGSLTTWTWSAWIKLSQLNDTYPCLFSAGDANDRFFVRYESGGTWEIFTDPPNGANIERHSTNAVFRDFSGWAHYVLVWNTTSSTAAERVRFYVNGVEQTLDGTFSQNLQSSVNDSTEQLIGKEAGYARYLDGYLADVHFIDGQALAPTDFGEFDDNGVWQPIEYTGTYGTNGFHLFDFANVSGIGEDSSGNDNDFTVNNLSTGVYSGTKPKWYTTTTLYTTKADVIANGTDRGQSAFTLTTAEFVYLIPNDGGAKGEVCHSSGSTYPSTFYTYVRDDDDTTWKYTGGFGDYQADDYIWDDTVTVDNIAFGEMKFSTQIDLYLIGDDRAGSPYQPTTDAKMSGSFPALINLVGEPDVLYDSPTNGTQTDTGAGGEVSGNYATLNPLEKHNTLSPVFSNGNLEITDTGQTGYNNAFSTIGVSSGKWYVECTNTVGAFNFVGIQQGPVTDGYIGNDAAGNGWSYAAGGYVRHARTNKAYGSVTYGNGDVIGIALDLDSATKTLTFYKNGTSLGIAYSGSELDADVYHFGGTLYTTNDKQVWNFGQRAFAYAAPSGFKALCTANLSDPTIADGSTAMDVVTYDGTQVTRSITGLDFGPDLVWTKSRSNTTGHEFYDSVRGAQKLLYSNLTNAETTVTNGISSFNSDGWTMGNRSGLNYLSRTYVAWTWDAGTSTVSNTDGDITSSVRANPSAGFSIVKWTSIAWTGSAANRQVGHGLNAAPALIITKGMENAASWYTYHKDTDATNPNDYYLLLNATDARGNLADSFGPNIPDNTTFGDRLLGYSAGEEVIAYCFAPVEGYSAFGSYEGNGSTDGPFVFTGFKIRWLMIKNGDATGDWVVYDEERIGYNPKNYHLHPNNTNIDSDSEEIDLLSNGFKLKSTQAHINGSGNTIIYACFSENPFKTARAR